jgi:uncharacterized protein (TIGR02246 family)
MRSRTALAFLVAFAAMAVGCGSNPPSPEQAAPAVDRAAEEARIRALDAEWSKAAQGKDVEKAIGYYADDGVMLAPGAPAARGKQAIEKAWTAMLSPAGNALSFQPTSIEVARGGDLAYDLGTYELTMAGKNGKAQTMKGVYVVVWQKQPGGQWKVLLDSPTTTTP